MRPSAQVNIGAYGGVAVWSGSKGNASVAAPGRRQSQVSLFCGDNWLEHFAEYFNGLSEVQRLTSIASQCDVTGAYHYCQAEPLNQVYAKLTRPWLPRLLDEQLVTSHLQPLARPLSGEVVGYEALARAYVDGKLVNGGELADAAHAHREGHRFDRVARQAAVRAAATHLQDSEQIFINVFPQYVENAQVDLEDLWRCLRQNNWSPENTVIEIVECPDEVCLEKLGAIVRACRANGARVALDDVCLGEPTLAQITKLRPDMIKLDRSLMPATQDDPKFGPVAALVRFALAANVEVVAEGIENSDHLEVAVALGANLVQGWFVGRPEALPQRKVSFH